jgi:hypothetical protein
MVGAIVLESFDSRPARTRRKTFLMLDQGPRNEIHSESADCLKLIHSVIVAGIFCGSSKINRKSTTIKSNIRLTQRPSVIKMRPLHSLHRKMQKSLSLAHALAAIIFFAASAAEAGSEWDARAADETRADRGLDRVSALVVDRQCASSRAFAPPCNDVFMSSVGQ